MERLLFTTISVDELTTLIQESVRAELSRIEENKPSKLSSGELITIDDVVKLFRISKVTLHDWKKKGILPYYRISRRVYFKLSEINEVLEANRRNSTKQ
ncbi:MAG: DNA-binding protein [Bacteroidetes bacterium]|nr:MAG: DNA-binding protein [Bacteroidota bacterium]